MSQTNGAVSGVRFITMPFHLGRPGGGMAAGPETILRALRDENENFAGVATSTIPPVSGAYSETASIFEVNRRLSREVMETIGSGEFPLVLSGNCNCCLGIVSGMRSPRAAAVWFDAHTDFNTPETTRSGFFDGMAAAVLTGHAYIAMAASIPGFRALRDEDVIMAGVRDFEPHEREQPTVFSATWILGDELSATGTAVIRDALSRLEPNDIYLHVDLDSIDANEGRANKYAAPGGPSLKQVCDSIELIIATGKVRAAAVTAYDPESDADGRALRCATAVVRTIAAGF